MQRSTPMRKYFFICACIVASIAIVIQVVSLTLVHAASPNMVPTAGDWTTYVGNQQRTGFNNVEATIRTSNVRHLVLKWSQHAARGVSDQPIEVSGDVFWGSWDGYFHAFTTSGHHIWDTQIGTTRDSSCNPAETGVAGTAAFGTINSTPTIFVSGGNASFYALDANTGQIIWSTRLGSSPSHFLWDSPLLANGSVYIGASSYGDCPLVEGRVMKLDASTGQLQNTFNVVPSGCLGAGVWSSPALDPTSSTLFVTTGNADSCKQKTPYGSALVQLNASDLSVVNSWQVPKGQQTGDGDFGATPTVFDANGKHYIGVANKNGIFYLFDRDNIGAGPIFETHIAVDNGDCPQCGDGSIVPGAWNGSLLYVAGAKTTIGKTSCKGSVQAIDPSKLAVVWKHCMQSGVVLGPLTVANGVVIATQGQDLNYINAATGTGISYFHDGRAGALFYGGASVSHGRVFVGNMDGYLYAFGLP
jgi:outer membrane protein assembly factor BamB